MLTQKQWKTQHLAEQMLNLAVSAAAEAGRQSAQRQLMVREHAVIAEEARSIARQIMEAVEQNIFGGLRDEEFDGMMLTLSKRSALLTLNTALVCCKVSELKPLAVFAENLRDFSLELGGLYGNEQEYADIPEVSPRSRMIPGVFYLFSAESGEYTWYENARFVQEILDYCPEYIQGSRLVIKNARRDLDVPFIRLGEVPKDPAIVIISDALDPKRLYAVLARAGIHSLANSYVGVPGQCTADIPVRECWSASCGELIFPDWEKLSEQARSKNQ